MTATVCAIVPFWSQSDAMNWDSNYAYLRRVMPGLMDALPDWLWVILWPMVKGGNDTWRWHNDGLFDDPRIMRFGWPYDTAMRSSVSGWDPLKFRDLEIAYAPAVYWCHQVESATHIDGGYQQSFNRSARPIIVSQHFYVIHESLPYPLFGMFDRRWMQMGGSLVAQRVVMNSQHAYTMLRESFGEYLNDATMDALLAKTRVLPFGLVTAEHMAIPITPHDRPIVVYNHRFENYKRPDDTAALLNEARSAGHDFEVWVTQTVSQKVSDFPFDRIVGHPDQMTYLRSIAVPGINVSNSVHETFCISMLDSIMLGQLPLAPRAVTFPELVPPDYPFLFTSRNEQRVMFDHLVDTWPLEYTKWSDVLRAHAWSTFGLDSYCQQYAALLDEASQEPYEHQAKDHIIERRADFLRRLPVGRYSLDRIGGAMRKALRLAIQAYPNRRVLRDLAYAGASFAFDGSSVVVDWSGMTLMSQAEELAEVVS